MGIFSWLLHKKPPVSIKLGLALGSGGAKGFAELGILRALEENGIVFDVVAGTSIGSVIGAFYANGYTSTDISEMLKGIDLSEIKNFTMIKMDTAGMFKVIDRSIGSLNIEELKKPFMAVATVAETGEEHVFDKGSVARALCASSSYPPFFKPVTIDGVKYVDGAFTNSVPADLCVTMGADYVLGVDLSTHEAKGGFFSRFIPTFDNGVEEPWKKGYENADLMLHPDLKDYKAIGFWDGDKMYEIGYRTAIENMDAILRGIENAKIAKSGKASKKGNTKKAEKINK